MGMPRSNLFRQRDILTYTRRLLSHRQWSSMCLTSKNASTTFSIMLNTVLASILQ
ncbi:hypothetical protein KP509_01G090200 [Ceratopteris richardii]|uniref:Uncharacterized protein n=2 Tax=Ceratopteris richardii TaxID=49495 RepID=A0A8T2VID7_CERRI|nr:hypothetical protein KP509_01G090200 [Ceratopteris richardii]